MEVISGRSLPQITESGITLLEYTRVQLVGCLSIPLDSRHDHLSFLVGAVVLALGTWLAVYKFQRIHVMTTCRSLLVPW